MDKTRITIILILTCIIIVGTTCLAATGIVNAPSGLVLRETPSKNADPITTISDESKVEVIKKEGDWYKVKYGEYEGYLYAEYVNLDEELAEPTEQEEVEQNESSSEEETSATETVNTINDFPKSVTTNTTVKAYLIPSVVSRVIANIEEGKQVTINYELGNWFNITYEEKEYWVRKYSLTTQIVENNEGNSEDGNEASVKVEKKKGYINVTTAANVRENASTSADVVTSLTRNTEVTIVAEEGDFYKIEYQNITGYISKSLVSDTAVETTSRSNGGQRKTETQSANTEEQETKQEESIIVPSTGSSGADIAEFAKQFVGYSYVYGGTTPSGFDCTGFAYYVYNSCGVSLSRSCSVQSRSGVEVSRDELQPGDLILFNNGGNGTIGHVGIYIGDGYIVHAQNSRTGVVTSTINSGYYNTYYYSARRIVN